MPEEQQQGSSAPAEPGKRDFEHEVQGDEDLAWIAYKYGFGDWKPIADHEKNKKLWDDGRTPHSLHKGDKVWVPSVTPKVFECRTNEKHVFNLERPKIPIEVSLQDEDGLVHSDVKYEIWVAGRRVVPPQGSEEVVRTTSTGTIRQVIPLTKDAEIRVWFGPKGGGPDDDEILTDEAAAQQRNDFEADPLSYTAFPVHFGHMDPLSTIEGVQDRLNNLGYPCGDEQGTVGEKTKEALKLFQADYEVKVTGEIDDATKKALGQVYDGQQDQEEGASSGGPSGTEASSS